MIKRVQMDGGEGEIVEPRWVVLVLVLAVLATRPPVFAETHRHYPLAQPVALSGSDPQVKIARPGEVRHRIVIRGKESATVTNPEVRVADVADITSPNAIDDDFVLALRRAVVGASPALGESATISAQQVLEAIRMVPGAHEAVGYLLPRVVTVTRASRTIGADEITRALTSFLGSMGKEARILEVSTPKGEIRVSPRAHIRSVVPAIDGGTGRGTSGVKWFQLTVGAEGDGERTFPVQARIQEWAEMPVAIRPLSRGEVVGAEDIGRAQVNLALVGAGVASDPAHIVGQRLSQDMPSGGLFRLQSLESPPMVRAGERVTLLYRSGVLEATASAVALDGGPEGARVRVRNESSKRIVQGTISGPGMIEVQP